MKQKYETPRITATYTEAEVLAKLGPATATYCVGQICMI